MPRHPATSAGLGSRTLIIGLLTVALLVAALTLAVARSRRVQAMRRDLAEVLAQCRARYAGALTGADTAAVDIWQPTLHARQRPGDPPCGQYRRRDMLR